MNKKSTSTLFDSTIVASEDSATQEAFTSAAGSPRKSTLSLIRQFARAYSFDNRCSIPAGIILN